MSRRTPLAGILIAVLLIAGDVAACSVCYGDPDSAQVKGAEAGILVLFGVIATLLASIAGVALFWMHRARVLSATANAVPFPGEGRTGGLSEAD